MYREILEKFYLKGMWDAIIYAYFHKNKHHNIIKGSKKTPQSFKRNVYQLPLTLACLETVQSVTRHIVY